MRRGQLCLLVLCLCGMLPALSQSVADSVGRFGHTAAPWETSIEYEEEEPATESEKCSEVCCESEIYPRSRRHKRCSLEGVVLFGGSLRKFVSSTDIETTDSGFAWTSEVRVLVKRDGTCNDPALSNAGKMAWASLDTTSSVENQGRGVRRQISPTSAVLAPRAGHSMHLADWYIFPKPEDETTRETSAAGAASSSTACTFPTETDCAVRMRADKGFALTVKTQNVFYALQSLVFCVSPDWTVRKIKDMIVEKLSVAASRSIEFKWYQITKDSTVHLRKMSLRVNSYIIFGGHNGARTFSDSALLHVHVPAEFNTNAEQTVAKPFATVKFGALSSPATKLGPLPAYLNPAALSTSISPKAPLTSLLSPALDVRWEAIGYKGAARPLPRYQQAATMAGPLLLIHGGIHLDYGFLDDLWMFDTRVVMFPKSDHGARSGAEHGWSEIKPPGPPMPPRAGHSAVTITMQATVYIVYFGGVSTTGVSSDLWILRTGCVQNDQAQGSDDGRIDCGIFPKTSFEEKHVDKALREKMMEPGFRFIPVPEDRTWEQNERDALPPIRFQWLRVREVGATLPGPRAWHFATRWAPNRPDADHMQIIGGWGLEKRGSNSVSDAARPGFYFQFEASDWKNYYRGLDWKAAATHSAMKIRPKPAALAMTVLNLKCDKLVDMSDADRDLLDTKYESRIPGWMLNRNELTYKLVECTWTQGQTLGQTTARRQFAGAVLQDGTIVFSGGLTRDLGTCFPKLQRTVPKNAPRPLKRGEAIPPEWPPLEYAVEPALDTWETRPTIMYRDYDVDKLSAPPAATSKPAPSLKSGM